MDTREYFVIQGLGGKRMLRGEVSVAGAKNAVLQAFAFTPLFSDEVVLKNVPEIEDVKRSAELLEELGAVVVNPPAGGNVKSYSVKFGPDASVGTGKNIKSELTPEISKKMRASIVFSGPLLARTGKVSFPHPGGCVIGARPIDLFLSAFQKMGATLTEGDGKYTLTAPKGGLRGADIFFKGQSVTGTQSVMMAAVLARGKTTIRNAALEPETESLANFLNKCGAKIKGAGTSTIEVTGVRSLFARGQAYVTPPDRIEAGSFVILAALAAADVTIKNCEPKHMHALIEALRTSGVNLSVGKNWIRVVSDEKDLPRKSLDIKTHEYPGFPTDLQAPMVVYLTQTEGEALVFETIFEGRLNFVTELARMGANVKLWDPHRATVKGLTPLHGREVESPDIRAGLAFVMAAIVAEGESIIHNVYYIDRGYENVEERLRGLGVSIKRVSMEEVGSE